MNVTRYSLGHVAIQFESRCVWHTAAQVAQMCLKQSLGLRGGVDEWMFRGGVDMWMRVSWWGR